MVGRQRKKIRQGAWFVLCSRYNLKLVGVWRSLVAHLVWDQGVQGSNPCTPTKNLIKKSSLCGLFLYLLPFFCP